MQKIIITGRESFFELRIKMEELPRNQLPRDTYILPDTMSADWLRQHNGKKLTIAHLLAYFKLLPSEFNDYELKDDEGWTVAHSLAASRYARTGELLVGTDYDAMPVGFPSCAWGYRDNERQSVAEYFMSEYPQRAFEIPSRYRSDPDIWDMDEEAPHQ